MLAERLNHSRSDMDDHIRRSFLSALLFSAYVHFVLVLHFIDGGTKENLMDRNIFDG